MYIPLGVPGTILGNRAIQSVRGYKATKKRLQALTLRMARVEIEFLIKAAGNERASSEALHYVAKRVKYLMQLVRAPIPEVFFEEVIRRARVMHVREQLLLYKANPHQGERVHTLEKLQSQYFMRHNISFEEVGLTAEKFAALKRWGVIADLKPGLVGLRKIVAENRVRRHTFTSIRSDMARYGITCREMGISRKDPLFVFLSPE